MLFSIVTEVECFLLVEFGPTTVECWSEHEFLLERLHVEGRLDVWCYL